jgi:hypothetical protein
MVSLLIPRTCRLRRVQCAAAWVCAFSLILVLANRFPRIEGKEEISWVASAASRVTAKVMAKDFFVLPPPPTGSILLPRFVPLRIETRGEHFVVSMSMDNRLLTRPPPAS